MRINFINDGHRNCGGCLQFIKYANAMAGMGHTVTLTYYVGFNFDLIEVLPRKIYSPTLNPEEIPDADVIISSSWSAAEKVAGLPLSKGEKFYYVQDYENFSGPSEAITRSWCMPATKIAVAEYLKELILQQTSTRVHVIPYGIDFDVFHPTSPKAMEQNEIVVGGLYNPAPRKRFTDFAAVIQRLRQRRLPVRLELFGTGEKPELPFDFRYARRPSRQALNEMLNRCHVWLTMSDQEGLHIPPMEAMACGAVPVVTNIGGMDYCLHGETGFTVPVGGVKEASAAIERLFHEPKTWMRMSEKALGHIRAMGSERDNVDKMLALFEERIKEKDSGRSWLFDFSARNQNTWKTLEAYLEQADAARRNGDAQYASDLYGGVVRVLEKWACEAGGNHFLGLRGRLYGKALFELERPAETPDRERTLRAMGYRPNQTDASGLLERALGREILGTFFSPEPFEGFIHIWMARPCQGCGLNCGVRFGQNQTAFDSRSPEEWAGAVNMHQRHVLFSGPDSLLGSDFADMVNAITPAVAVAARFPLEADVSHALRLMEREIFFVLKDRQAAHENNLSAIKDSPLVSVGFPQDRPGADFFNDPDMPCGKLMGLGPVWERPKWPSLEGVELAYCRKRGWIVGPDGRRYHCVSRLAAEKESDVGFFDAPFDSDISLKACRCYGKCAPCDAFGDTVVIFCGEQKG
ncbi:MAG: glycosyltransferase family 4 protein [Thermodesulfobacteriota bacterium]|nr:glycosyltransferase family 4 protein [Thermodesulfobacteriota bacterium]